MNNLIPELHLVLLVIEFVWGAITSFRDSDRGAEIISEIEAVLGEIDGPDSQSTSAGASGNKGNTLAQRRAEKGL